MKVDASVCSHQGSVRTNNEDRYLIDGELGLYILCDGMGGHASGELAAQLSVTYAAEHIRANHELIRNAAQTPDGYFRVLDLAEEATQEASRRIYEQACNDSSVAGMGTTMTLLLVVENKAIMAHVGDSRLYLYRNSEVHLLSTDHTLANEMVRAGKQTKEQAATSSYRHVLTRTIGNQALVQVETLLFDLVPGDLCLLCSDGLSNYFESNKQIVELLGNDPPSNLPGRLIGFANEQGGADNITAMTVSIGSDSSTEANVDIPLQLNILRTNFLCQNLSTKRLIRVLNSCSISELSEGQRLFDPTKGSDGLFILIDGKLKVETQASLSRYLTPGESICETSLLGARARPGRVTAKESCRLFFLSSQVFRDLIQRFPKLGNVLMRNLASTLSQQLERLAESEGNTSDTVEFEISDDISFDSGSQ